MCIAGDMERVYEIAPVFRAENSNTHRHMTEFVGLDLEMAIDEHYHEVLDVLDSLFLSIFRGLQSKFGNEIETIKKQFPSEDFVFLDKTLRLTFAEGMKMLKEAGATEANGQPIGEMDDMRWVQFPQQLDVCADNQYREREATRSTSQGEVPHRLLYPRQIPPFHPTILHHARPSQPRTLQLVRFLHARRRDLVGGSTNSRSGILG